MIDRLLESCVSLVMIDRLLRVTCVSCDDWQVVKSCVSLVMIDRLLESRVCLVMIDRLLEAIDDMKRVIMDSAQFLLTPDKAHYSYSDAALIFDVVCVCTWSLMLWYLIDCHTQHVMNWQFSAGQLSVRYVQWLSTSVHSCPTCAHISKTKQERSIVTVTIVLWPSICSAIEKRFTYLLTYLLTYITDSVAVLRSLPTHPPLGRYFGLKNKICVHINMASWCRAKAVVNLPDRCCQLL